MLGHPLEYLGILFQQLTVPFLRAVFNPGKKQFFNVQQSLVRLLFHCFADQRRALDNLRIILFGERVKYARFQAFDRIQAGLAVTEAFGRRNALSFKEKLESNVFAVLVERKSEAALFDKVDLPGNLSFFEQHGFGRNLLPPEQVTELSPLSLNVLVRHEFRVNACLWRRP